jgi:predicted AAA+ superfamily ATPase
MQEIFIKLYKYNLWKGEEQKIETGFAREFYLQKIEQYLGNNLIKVFIGQRRVGKSFLLKQVMKQLVDSGVSGKNIFYLNKEIVDFDDIRTYLDLKKIIDIYKKKIKPKGKVYFFIDEIQEIEKWQKIINSLAQDPVDKSEVFISGSNSKLLSGELATYLTGRYVDFEIFPFSYREYREYFKLENSRKVFLRYLKNGGLPELFDLKTEESKRHYLQALKDSIILKDIVGRHNVQEEVFLSRILDFVADNIGNTFSVASLVKFFKAKNYKVSFDTISNYLGFLQETFLIHEISRFDIKGKKILESSKKYYINDLAFRNFVFSTFDTEIGGHLENIIFLHLKREGYKNYIGKIKNLEVDFIAEKGKEKIYFQVTYSVEEKKVAQREFGNLQKIEDNFEKIVLTLDDVVNTNHQGIKHQEIWKFLE